MPNIFKVKQPKNESVSWHGGAEASTGNTRENTNDYITAQVLTIKSGTIQNSPTNNTDIVNKAYADSLSGGSGGVGIDYGTGTDGDVIV